MSLNSSLFSGVSGLSTLSSAMTVIGDNIANVNTIGFKSSRANFQDVLSQTVATQSGSAQVGRGTALGDISSVFGQGSFESTESSTDLAIGGDGFFILRDPDNENSTYYSRAGNFRFDEDGDFITSAGYIVRGWELNRNETTGDVEDVGSITDIRLASFTSPPEATDKITVITNLDSRGEDNAQISGMETIPLSLQWNGDTTSVNSCLEDNAFEYQSTVKVYDSLGSTHDITIYYDCGDKDSIEPTYEYIVTCNPTEDARDIFNDDQTDAGIGLLGRGVLTFASDGTLKEMSFSRFIGNSGTTAGDSDKLDDPNCWAEMTVDDEDFKNGHFTFNANFLGADDTNMQIELDFGATCDAGQWNPDSLSTTQYASASTTVFQSSSGYGAGDLQSISVDVDGVITGQYSNGQVTPLFRVGLAKFQNVQGLYKEGGSLFSETRTSGAAITGKPGANGLGSIAPNSLEQSNVDIASEFVKMITTQRGFQANSKIITTVDSMLADTINLK